MHQIGMFILMAGFCGIPAFLVTGLTRNTVFGAIAHVALVMAYAIYLSVSGTRAQSQLASRSQAIKVLLIGLGFLGAGIYVTINGNPSDGPEAMTRSEIIHFGIIFILLGSGTATFALPACRAS